MKDNQEKSSFRAALSDAERKVASECESDEAWNNSVDDRYSTAIGTERAAQEAGDMHKIHSVYADYFVSFMRVRYAWGIFAMLICWLGVDVVVLLAHATKSLDVYVMYGLGGALAGFWIGGMWGYACRNWRGLRDVKAVYKLGVGTPERMDLSERNIQLRVWRSVGSVPICLICTVLGAVLMRGLAPFLAQGASVVPFRLSNTVLITLIGSTTASVIGIFLIVLHWLFPRAKEEARNQPKVDDTHK